MIFATLLFIKMATFYKDGNLEMQSKSGMEGASNSETDRYEELLVNPTGKSNAA